MAAALTHSWGPRSRLFLVGEGAGWSIDHDLQELGSIAGQLGVRLADRRLLSASRGQAAFYGSQFTLLSEPWQPPAHALGTAYFHGRPGTPGMPEFDVAYRLLGMHHEQLDRVQVTHREMRDVVLSTGIDPSKVFLIRIGIDLRLFSPQTAASRSASRVALGLPEGAFLVGSFQKDGIGWGAGDEPKAIKGPDVLLETLKLVHDQVPELHVLLSGPARGYVRSGLEAAEIPYVHRRLERYEQIAELYASLDAYVVPSRQEGGPKGVLEAMASGVPVATTRVGQAAELVRDGENGRIVDVDDADALAAALVRLAGDPVERKALAAAGRETAAANAYETQLSQWRAFFEGFVAHA